MGFMRKAFFLGTVGLSGAVGVRANSKKQRAAKAAETQVRLQKQVIKQQAADAAATRAAPVARVLATNVPAVEEQFDVILTAVDPAEKIATMKLVYQVTDLSLATCKRIVDAPPGTVKERIGSAEANALKARLGDVHAAAELRPSPESPSRDDAESCLAPPDAAVELASDLVRLAELHRSGALSDRGFAAAKARVLLRTEPLSRSTQTDVPATDR